MEYWDNRYRKGGNSGTAYQREWTWKSIGKYIPHYDNIIDIGCGDLTLWEGRDATKFTGIDVSPTIIERNRVSRKNWNFICSPAEKKLSIPKARIVQCLSVLFHIMDNQTYENILRNIISYSDEWIVILTWSSNPFTASAYRMWLSFGDLKHGRIRNAFRQLRTFDSDLYYQKYRKFDEYFPIFQKEGFELKGVENDSELSKIGALYFFQKSLN